MPNIQIPEFPHERIVFFSDAVFAIAITLLIIEIKVPSHVVLHEIGVGGALNKLIPLFTGFVVSFLVTGLFWKAHLIICQRIKHFDHKLLWINIFLLLFVALMPFSTAFYSENFNLNGSFIFYCLNLAAIGFFSFWMTAYSIKKENIASQVGSRYANWIKLRALISPLIFLLCIALTFLSPFLSRFSFILIFVFQSIGDRIYKKHAPATGAQSLT